MGDWKGDQLQINHIILSEKTSWSLLCCLSQSIIKPTKIPKKISIIDRRLIDKPTFTPLINLFGQQLIIIAQITSIISSKKSHKQSKNKQLQSYLQVTFSNRAILSQFNKKNHFAYQSFLPTVDKPTRVFSNFIKKKSIQHLPFYTGFFLLSS